MKTAILLLFFASLISCNNKTDNIVPRAGNYSNGGISTGVLTNSGVSAPAGYTWSEAQHNTGNTSISNGILGASCYSNTYFKYKITDDFVIPAGQSWQISSISVYAFRENYAGNTCPIDSLKLMIWDGHPRLTSSSLVYGDSTTNVLSSSVDSLCYAIQNSSIPAPGVPPVANTKIWKLTANVNKTLSAGTYWLAWQTHDILNGQNYSPPVKVKGTRGLPGWNAAIYNALRIWQNALDISNPSGTQPYVPQDFPFEIVYTY